MRTLFQRTRPGRFPFLDWALPGVALFSGLIVGLPLTPHTLAQMQALNRELGKLCSSPPREALSVCRIHARLVDAL